MKIETDVATQDVERFISNLKINPVKLKALQEEKEKCIELVEQGMLSIREDGTPVFHPYDEVEYGEKPVKDIPFKMQRMSVKDLEKYAVGKTDIEKTRRTFSCIVDGNFPSGFFGRMSSDDFINFSYVAAFFLPR